MRSVYLKFGANLNWNTRVKSKRFKGGASKPLKNETVSPNRYGRKAINITYENRTALSNALFQDSIFKIVFFIACSLILTLKLFDKSIFLVFLIQLYNIELYRT